jgi:hypothetical protein
MGVQISPKIVSLLPMGGNINFTLSLEDIILKDMVYYGSLYLSGVLVLLADVKRTARVSLRH